MELYPRQTNRFCTYCLAAVLPVISFSSPSWAQLQALRLQPENGVASQFFGQSVALNDNTALVGDRGGSSGNTDDVQDAVIDRGG